MIENYLRSIYQYFFIDPLAKIIYQRFTSFQITYLSCLLGIASAPALLLGRPFLASVFLLLFVYLDTLDGTVARFSGSSSPAGTVIDIVTDRVVEFAIFIGLFAVDPVHRAWMILMMLGSCFIGVTSFLVVGMYVPNRSTKGFYFSPGLIERAQTFIFFLLMIWFPSYFHLLAILFSILVCFTAYMRIKQFLIWQQN